MTLASSVYESFGISKHQNIVSFIHFDEKSTPALSLPYQLICSGNFLGKFLKSISVSCADASLHAAESFLPPRFVKSDGLKNCGLLVSVTKYHVFMGDIRCLTTIRNLTLKILGATPRSKIGDIVLTPVCHRLKIMNLHIRSLLPSP